VNFTKKVYPSIFSIFFKASFLSGYGVKVTLYATVPGRVQVWTSNEEKTVLKLLVKAANKEAGLPRDHDECRLKHECMTCFLLRLGCANFDFT
jgi:hypothetical protein